MLLKFVLNRGWAPVVSGTRPRPGYGTHRGASMAMVWPGEALAAPERPTSEGGGERRLAAAVVADAAQAGGGVRVWRRTRSPW